jgi:hypothetical protein
MRDNSAAQLVPEVSMLAQQSLMSQKRPWGQLTCAQERRALRLILLQVAMWRFVAIRDNSVATRVPVPAQILMPQKRPWGQLTCAQERRALRLILLQVAMWRFVAMRSKHVRRILTMLISLALQPVMC